MGASEEHAKYSASGSERWLKCSGSIKLSETAPPSVDSVYAAEGSQAHACLEQFLKNPQNRARAVKDLLLKTNPMEMVLHALDAAIEIWRRAPAGAEILAETKVHLDMISADMWGTTDCLIVEDFGCLEVIDFKYGAGVAVDAVGNSQLAYYGLGAAAKYGYDFTEVKLTIIQPRAEHPDGPFRTWRLTMKELRGWETTFRKGFEAGEDPLATLEPGDHCRWCPCKPICPELSNKALARARADFRPFDPVVGSGAPATELVSLPDIRIVPLPNLPVILDAVALIDIWIDGVRHHAANVLESGGEIPGWKMVPKEAKRRWKDEDVAREDALLQWGDKVLTAPELLSPAQLEKLTKDKVWVAARVTRESSGLKMVRESDARPGTTGAIEDFKNAPALPPADPADALVPLDLDNGARVLVPRSEAERIQSQSVTTKVKTLPKAVASARTKPKSKPKAKPPVKRQPPKRVAPKRAKSKRR